MSATTQESFTGWCCVDCLMLLANGETDPDWSDIGTADYLLSVDQNTAGYELTLGLLYGEPGCVCTPETRDDHAELCEEITFSWSTCDVCGSRLGGSRHAVTFWEPRS